MLSEAGLLQQGQSVVEIMVGGVVFANVGLPMIVVAWPMAIVSLVPVIALESWIVWRNLRIPRKKAILKMSKANALSTLVGIPLTWIALAAIELGLGVLCIKLTGGQYGRQWICQGVSRMTSAPWLGPYAYGWHWRVPLATLILLLPFFYASYRIEAWCSARGLLPESPARAKRAIWVANVASYAAMFLGCVVWLVVAILTKPIGD